MVFSTLGKSWKSRRAIFHASVILICISGYSDVFQNSAGTVGVGAIMIRIIIRQSIAVFQSPMIWERINIMSIDRESFFKGIFMGTTGNEIPERVFFLRIALVLSIASIIIIFILSGAHVASKCLDMGEGNWFWEDEGMRIVKYKGNLYKLVPVKNTGRPRRDRYREIK